MTAAPRVAAARPDTLPAGWHIVRLDDTPAQAWRNGGGRTRELLAWPPAGWGGDGSTSFVGAGDTKADLGEAQADTWLCRISVADIEQDGPFSAFPGVRRWFAVLHGDGVVLSLPGGPHTLRPGSPPLAFDGALAPACQLTAGPTQDLNLMLRHRGGPGGHRGAGHDGSTRPGGGMQVAAPGQPWRCRVALRAVFTLDKVHLGVEGQPTLPLPAGSLCWSDEATQQAWTLQADADAPPRAWWMHLEAPTP